MVVATFSNASALKAVVDGLAAGSADIERLRVLTCDEIPTELASTDVQFIWLGDVDRISAGDELGTGTGVPGITSGGGATALRGDELLECLSELGIPDGNTDEYALAVEQGRMLVGYPSSGDSGQLHALFSNAGATKIEEFS